MFLKLSVKNPETSSPIGVVMSLPLVAPYFSEVVVLVTDDSWLGGFRSAAARELAPSARGDGPDGRGPKSAVPVFVKFN